jgi:hypothetical protein
MLLMIAKGTALRYTYYNSSTDVIVCILHSRVLCLDGSISSVYYSSHMLVCPIDLIAQQHRSTASHSLLYTA